MTVDGEIDLELVTVGQPDMSGRLLRGYGTSAIRRYLTDTTLTEGERGSLKQLGRSLRKLNRDQGLWYIADDLQTNQWATNYLNVTHCDPLHSAYIKFWDPQAEDPYNSIALKIKNPETIFEYSIGKAFIENIGQPEKRDVALKKIFSYNIDGRMPRKPTVEISLVQRDKKTLVSAASIGWEWDFQQQRVVTTGYLPKRDQVRRRNDVIPDKVPGLPRREVPIVSFVRMRNAIILQAASSMK